MECAPCGEATLEDLLHAKEDALRKIAEKRQQIEELQRQRLERRAKFGTGELDAVASTGPVALSSEALGQEFDESVEYLVAGIVGRTPAAVPTTKCRTKKAASAKKTISAEKPLQELKQHIAATDAGRPCAADRVLFFQEQFSLAKFTIEPPKSCKYERAAQTEVTGEEAKNNTSEALEQQSERTMTSRKSVPAVATIEVGTDNSSSSGPHDRQGRKSIVVDPSLCPSATAVLSNEDREIIEQNPKFQAFFQRSTLLVERHLCAQEMPLHDAEQENDETMTHFEDFGDDRFTRSRPVTDVQFSPHHRQMFLASYGDPTERKLTDVPGCALVWNLSMRSRPEIAFTCSSPVYTTQFHRYEPSLFFGGTYSGSVVLWDARAKTTPVSKSLMYGKGHSHPVQAMQQVGTENSANLVTASNDGRLCVWSLAMLNEPAESLDLRYDIDRCRRDFPAMCMSFPQGETNTLYAGAGDGSFGQVHIHGTKVGVTQTYVGHEGPITSVDAHPRSQCQSNKFTDLMLTSSFDWTVKLWNVRKHQRPLLTIDAFEDYVLDVRWHPSHPAAFATADGEGTVNLWNLNESTESAVARQASVSQRKVFFNRCCWSPNGRDLATGDSEGTVSVYAINSKIWRPRSEDFLQFEDLVRDLKPVQLRTWREGGLSRTNTR